MSSARCESELGSVNPPFERCFTTLPPNAPAKNTPIRVPIRIHRRRLTVNLPSLSSISRLLHRCSGAVHRPRPSNLTVLGLPCQVPASGLLERHEGDQAPFGRRSRP